MPPKKSTPAASTTSIILESVRMEEDVEGRNRPAGGVCNSVELPVADG